MEITISNEIVIKNPIEEIKRFCKKELVVANPEFYKKLRMGFWIDDDTSDKLFLYRVDGPKYFLPYGVWGKIRKLVPEDSIIITDFSSNPKVSYEADVSLYDYQTTAVNTIKKTNCGILQAPCGSGKTQMGIALAAELGRKTLWLTHTSDLLNQSKKRASQYIDKSLIGTITGGKINISEGITFATVQTLSNPKHLPDYKYSWDVVIVDECHRVAGTPSSLTMFSNVINSLAAPFKYGLSATVYRGDGMIKSTFALLGEVACLVSEEAVADKTMDVTVQEIKTGIKIDKCCLNTDGTLNYPGLIDYLTGNVQRNKIIASKIAENKGHSNLIMSDRLQHLREIIECLKAEGVPEDQIRMIDGSMTSKKAKTKRQQAIEDMRTGKAHFLFVSYSLGKEGLDIPNLDRLYLALPKKDYAIITQSIGRIARTSPGKSEAICYDFVDNIGFCTGAWKNRKTSYRKKRCKIIEDLKPPAINNTNLLAFIKN